MLFRRKEGKGYRSSNEEQGEQPPGLRAQELEEMQPPFVGWCPQGELGSAWDKREVSAQVPAQSSAELESRGGVGTAMTMYVTPNLMTF